MNVKIEDSLLLVFKWVDYKLFGDSNGFKFYFNLEKTLYHGFLDDVSFIKGEKIRSSYAIMDWLYSQYNNMYLDERIPVKIVGYVYRVFFFIFFNRVVLRLRLMYDKYLCNHGYAPLSEGATYMGMEITNYYDPRKLKYENGKYVPIKNMV